MLKYITVIFALTILFILTFRVRRKQIQFLIFACLGIFLLMVSSMFYSIRKTGVYSGMAFNSFKFLYNTAIFFRLSFADIYRIANAGNFCIFCSLISMGYDVFTGKKVYFRYFLLIPAYLYLFLNDPDISYRLYLKSAELFIDSGRILLLLNIYNLSVTVFFLLLPLASIFLYYKRTSFAVKRRHAIFRLIYLLLYYAQIFVFNSAGLINFLNWASIQIVKYPEDRITDFTMSFIHILIYVVLLLIAVFTYKNFRMQSYSAKTVYKNTSILDKNLRMILHNYKNYFYIINQQLKYLDTLEENYSPQARKTLSSLENFSKDVIDEISERINALQNIKVSLQAVDLIECAEAAVNKLFLPEEIELIRDYRCDSALLYTEKKGLTEMVFNMLQNSIEAFCGPQPQTEHATIKMKIDKETDWLLLEITDNGCGISKHDKKSVFAPLFSGKQGKNNFGIGLHYVKKFVDAHKGAVFIDSELGKYTTIQVYLPTAEEQRRK